MWREPNCDFRAELRGREREDAGGKKERDELEFPAHRFRKN